MKKILIINATPRNEINREVIIPRKNYELKVPAESSCYKIQKSLINGYDSIYDCVNLNGIHPCTACYYCVGNKECCTQDVMKNIYPKLETCDFIVIITPLYYGTIPAQLLAFFNRLYPYWISSYNLNPKTGFPNNYPKLDVLTIGTCADCWQKWDLFDTTLTNIYNEIGWNILDTIHLPNYQDTQEDKKFLKRVMSDCMTKRIIKQQEKDRNERTNRL